MLNLGDRVRFTKKFLRSSGMVAGPEAPTDVGPWARGEVVKLTPWTEGRQIVTVLWDNGELGKGLSGVYEVIQDKTPEQIASERYMRRIYMNELKRRGLI